MEYQKLSEHEELLGKAVVSAAVEVHKRLGPGLLEKVYEICLAHELYKRDIPVMRQVDVPIHYDDLVFEEGLRLDLLVDGKVIVEIKAVETVHPVWQAQILSHLKLTRLRLGYLINFDVPLMKQGIRRYVR